MHKYYADRIHDAINKLCGHIESLHSALKNANAKRDKEEPKEERDTKPLVPLTLQSELRLPEGLVETYRADHESKKKEEPNRREIEDKRIRMEFWTLIGVGFTVLFTVLQWWELQKQTQAIVESLQEMVKQTPGVIVAGIGTRDSVTVAKDTLAKAVEDGKDNQRNFQTTVAQSKAALDASIDASRTDQRAWLAVTELILEEEIANGKLIRLDYRIINTGKTPALDEYSKALVSIRASEFQFPKFPPVNEIFSSAIIPPGGFLPFYTSDQYRFDSEVGLSQYLEKKARLYVHGYVRYRDTSQVPHWVTFCAHHTFGDGLKVFGTCGKGNAMDNNKKKDDPEGPPGAFQ